MEEEMNAWINEWMICRMLSSLKNNIYSNSSDTPLWFHMYDLRINFKREFRKKCNCFILRDDLSDEDYRMILIMHGNNEVHFIQDCVKSKSLWNELNDLTASNA